MRLVATEYVSLDGVFEEPGHWSGPFFNEEAAQFKLDELRASDALLLGRRTYEGFAAAWPSMGDDEAGFAEKMNSMPKYVVSSTLKNPEWSGSRLIEGDVAEEIRKLKQQPGQDLLLSGSAQLFNAMLQENLIDLYRFMLHPIVLGKGPRLFAEGVGTRTLKLAQTKPFRSGIVILEYEPA
ncbi:dihydrofolate reductase family protein [Candidatus Nephthysia bennettiae]|uniref:Dihydrofolate reductase family protein n=1 Tax=Candidatus Nephthysia bennettiae TaxID=3127016 RepID=A0A934KDQ2_9BACT|nr:dihydrofolate reductase family protein [Candidatus Dormibacteraeota bacterium]MBJ7610685.1 dihydrofolate reductase family protein [Candidatus Dormibacteraeota bacterium]PZS34046.1 MAG: pyrimidine reductase [Pseudonocardiales bacterium]